MDTRYPVRKADGKDFSREEMQDLLKALRQEKPGRWLAGENNMWHGGMHFSRQDVPWSVLTPDSGEDAVPLQCIADGELVAWRVCQDYVPGNLGEALLQHSPSFLLVRSVHKPTQDASTWLCFYTLYMHLAPLSCYPKWPVYQVTPQGNGLMMRHYSGSEVPGQAAPPEIAHKGYLHHGERVLIVRQETFLLHNREEVYGLAQRLKDGVPVGDKFWMSVRPAFVEAVGEQYGHLPGWMSVALKAGQFDQVVHPSVMTGIKAGDAVGFLGKHDIPDGFRNITPHWFSHIEVMSNDGRMPLFLDNPGQLHTGRQYRIVPEGKALYRRDDTESEPRFEDAGRTNAADAVEIIPQAAATTATDRTGVVYLRLRSGQWIRQDETEAVSQHDLTGLKFHAVAQPPVHNMEHSLEAPWVVETFRWLGQQMRDGRDRETVQMQAFYVRMADEVEQGHIPAGALARYQSAIANGLTHWNADIDFFLRRLVVKHESEWYGDSSHPKWADMLAPMSGDYQVYVKQWLDMHEWMSQVPEFSRDEAIWHFHPVEFMEAIKTLFNTKKIVGKEFVEFVFSEAKKNEAKSHVPAAITTAQAILETGYGNYVPVDINTGEYSNNLFGIKAHGNHSFVLVNTHEYINGVKTPVVDKFMKYDSYEDSISGRADFFVKNKRYHVLFDSQDPVAWARGLHTTGYATDPNYANKLISIMNKEGLL